VLAHAIQYRSGHGCCALKSLQVPSRLNCLETSDLRPTALLCSGDPSQERQLRANQFRAASVAVGSSPRLRSSRWSGRFPSFAGHAAVVRLTLRVYGNLGRPRRTSMSMPVFNLPVDDSW
jgi:hypothetical protein